jgi:putative membrane protein
MIANTTLPHVLAAINSMTVLTILIGFVSIKRGARGAHRGAMLVSAGLGVAFLVIYLTYHMNAGLAKFGGVGAARTIYFSILIVHILAAALAAVMVPLTLFRALRREFLSHRAIARRTLPLWLFVSVSGLVVYVLAVHIYPYGGKLS